jgi:hypothetical protein
MSRHVRAASRQTPLRMCFALPLMLAGCAMRDGHASREHVQGAIPSAATLKLSDPSAIPDRHTFIDLEAGWRVRVVTPLAKSGKGYRLAGRTSRDNNGVIQATIGGELAGYETDYYTVVGPERFLVHFVFDSADMALNGAVTPLRRSLVSPFVWPQGKRYVRLVYQIRVSASEHDMAVLAAVQRSNLDESTRELQADPAACGRKKFVYCVWVPQEVAVDPQMLQKVNYIVDWFPALQNRP